MTKSRYYWKSLAAHRSEPAQAIPHEELKELHRRRPAVHLLYAARQFGIIGLCTWGLWNGFGVLSPVNPLLWVPLAILQGFTFFNMTTLLHEVVHNGVFPTPRPGPERALGLAYAISSGISASQFTRWHLDHHDNLGSYEDDPKRHWLSPKRNARWYKLLYCTPVLMFLYFRAARQESASYEPELKQRIARERTATMLVQFGVMGFLVWMGGGLLTLSGWGLAARVQIVPYFVVFPVAFTLNRLGQHYNIDPTHPLKWSTLMKASRLWDFLFLYSNYHLEHHYFPRVPFYNLRKLHFRLQPFYARLGLRSHTYREIVWRWFVQNQKPHTDWEAAQSARPEPALAGPAR